MHEHSVTIKEREVCLAFQSVVFRCAVHNQRFIKAVIYFETSVSNVLVNVNKKVG